MTSGAFLNVIKQNMKILTESKTTKNIVKPIVLILLLYALEELLESGDFYSCPETGQRVYGALFLFGPGTCFSLLALLLDLGQRLLPRKCQMCHLSKGVQKDSTCSLQFRFRRIVLASARLPTRSSTFASKLERPSLSILRKM